MALTIRKIAVFMAAFLYATAPSFAKEKYAAFVLDVTSNKVLHEENAHAPRFPASVTKIMTLYLLFEALESKKVSLRTKMPISAKAAAQPPCKLGLRAGGTITVRDAILGIVTKSANDASVVVAEYLAGSEDAYARLMTKKARSLGMQATVFRNASGLPNPVQISTAHDLGILGQAVFKRFPAYYAYFRTQSFWYNNKRFANHNKLLEKEPNVDGIKTGLTNASGFNIVASAKRNGRRIIVVVMGGKTGPSRDQRAATLLNAAFAGDGNILNGTKALLRNATYTPQAPADDFGDDPLGAKIRQVCEEGGTCDEAQATSTTLRGRYTQDPVGAKIRTLATPVASPSGQGPRTWALQVGAFAKAKDAQAAAKTQLAKLANRKGVKVTVEQAARKRGRVFQARLSGFTEKGALDASRVLSQKGVQCLVLRPRASTLIRSAHNAR
ncbi:MAG: D-alanyl-D-alanine carboxypeptidase [Proteobacteria bacterium]|nr:D-alanyl-D-alanine carboxypeptidase [Pseudomonadota bacterium]